MPQQPGPFLLASPAKVSFPPGTYDFTKDAQDLAGTLNTTAAGWDPFIFDLGNMAAEPDDVALGVDLVGILYDLSAVGDALPLSYMPDIDAGWSSAQGMLQDALAFAPAQAWSDPGAPFEIPDSALVLKVPSIDYNAFTPAPNLTVGATTQGRNPALGLFNITHYGTANFAVGDQFEVVALGPAGAEVTVDATLDGQALPPNDVGPIDPNGQFFLQGIMGPESVGVWNQKWFIDGVIMADFNFVVTNA